MLGEAEGEAEGLARLTKRFVAGNESRAGGLDVLPCAYDVEARSAAEGRTSRGELEARQRITQAEPIQLRDAFQLKLVFAAEVEPTILDANLEKYQTELAERRNEYRRRLEATEIFELARSPREAELWRLSIENGLAYCKAQLEWVREARARLSKVKAPSKARPRTCRRSRRTRG